MPERFSRFTIPGCRYFGSLKVDPFVERLKGLAVGGVHPKFSSAHFDHENPQSQRDNRKGRSNDGILFRILIVSLVIWVLIRRVS